MSYFLYLIGWGYSVYKNTCDYLSQFSIVCHIPFLNSKGSYIFIEMNFHSDVMSRLTKVISDRLLSFMFMIRYIT